VVFLLRNADRTRTDLRRDVVGSIRFIRDRSRSIDFAINDRDLLEGASDSLMMAGKRARIIAITAIDNDNRVDRRIEARESETVSSRFGDSVCYSSHGTLTRPRLIYRC